MKVTGYKSITIKLEMDELEARWLKALMQNPFHDSFTSKGCEESETDTTMRKIFFDALTEAGV